MGKVVSLNLNKLEREMLAKPASEHVEFETYHTFTPGLYIRECRLKKGCLVLGHAHRYDQTNIMLTGKLVMLLDGCTTIIEAPYMCVASAGRKMAYVLENTTWLNIYPLKQFGLEDGCTVEEVEAVLFNKTELGETV